MYSKWKNQICQTTNLPKVDYLSCVLVFFFNIFNSRCKCDCCALLSMLFPIPFQKTMTSICFILSMFYTHTQITIAWAKLPAELDSTHTVYIFTNKEPNEFSGTISFYIYPTAFLANIKSYRNKHWMTQIFTIESNHRLNKRRDRLMKM